MKYNGDVLSEIRKIDNTRTTPLITVVILAVLLAIGIWFLRGGSFKLYASMFFGLYDVFGIVWLSIILVSFIQNIAFLPLRVLGEKMLPQFKDFEEELENAKIDDQSFLLKKKVSEGNSAILVYILNFVLVAIAFISAGRVFLLDFYLDKISTKYLYNFIPYPTYPLQGTIINLPFFKITQTYAVPWTIILMIWGGLIVLMVVLRFGWRLVKWLLWKNEKVLGVRIAYNKLLMMGGGIVGIVLVISTIILRNVPTGGHLVWLTADLAKQNTGFNVVTAVATFFATIYIGYSHAREGAKEALARGMPAELVSKVVRDKFKTTLRNAFFLAIFAYWLTHQMPSSHDLSVLAFEAIYIAAPYTIDAFVMKKLAPKKVVVNQPGQIV